MRQPGIREVLLIAAVAVAVVLFAAGLTALLPREGQDVVFHTPLLIAVLVLGTAFVLWRILRPPRHLRPSLRRRRSTRRGRGPRAARRRALGPAHRRRRHRRRGALLDAATRGLRARSSSRTTSRAARRRARRRLIHGGLRYLEQYQFGLVREALAERARLLRLAPAPRPARDVPVPALRPAGRRPAPSTGRDDDLRRARVGAIGRPPSPPLDRRRRSSTRRTCVDRACAAASSTTTRWRTTPGSRSPSCARRWPTRRGGARGDPRPGDRRRPRGRAASRGATLEDRRDRRDVRGPRVEPCSTRPASGARGRTGPRRRDRSASCRRAAATSSSRATGIPARGGMTLRIPGRVVFIVPWPRHWLIGTTDKPVPRRPSSVRRRAPTRSTRSSGRVNGALDLELSRDDVVGTYAGLRPLVAPSRRELDGQGRRASTG